MEELDRVSKRWQAIRRCWARSVMKTESPAESPHLDRMVIRMGRLGSRDPEWTIKRRDLMPMKTPAELAPTSSDMSRVLLSMRRALEALAILAERDATGSSLIGLRWASCLIHWSTHRAKMTRPEPR